MSSFCSCGNFDQPYCIDPNPGIVQIDNVNMSNNIGNYRPTYDIDNAESDSFIQYTKFINNSEKISTDPFTYYTGADFKVSNCNFLKNYGQTNPINQLLFCGPPTTIENCCFKENNCQYVFYVGSGKTMIVRNCYYDKSTTFGGTVQFVSSKGDGNTVSLTQFFIENCFGAKQKRNNYICSCNDIYQYHCLINLLAKSFHISILIEIY